MSTLPKMCEESVGPAEANISFKRRIRKKPHSEHQQHLKRSVSRAENLAKDGTARLEIYPKKTRRGGQPRVRDGSKPSKTPPGSLAKPTPFMF